MLEARGEHCHCLGQEAVTAGITVIIQHSASVAWEVILLQSLPSWIAEALPPLRATPPSFMSIRKGCSTPTEEG